MRVDWQGYWVATPTPFSADGSISENLVRKLMDMYVTQGVHGLVINGSTGEWCSQSMEERQAVAQIGVAEVAGRIPVIIGVSAYGPTECLQLASHAARIGANGIMVTPPPYYNLTEKEIFNFYKTINDGTPIPMMVYNWPRGIGVDMSVDLLARLGTLSNVVAIKESSGDELKTQKVYERILNDSISVRFFARFIHPRGADFLQSVGGDGSIDGGGLGAQFAVSFYNSWWNKELELMKVNSKGYANVSSQLVNADYSGKYASPVSQLKACMRVLDQPGGFVRPPLMEVVDQETVDSLRAILSSSEIAS